jgi:hypothetical protein
MRYAAHPRANSCVGSRRYDFRCCATLSHRRIAAVAQARCPRAAFRLNVHAWIAVALNMGLRRTRPSAQGADRRIAQAPGDQTARELPGHGRDSCRAAGRGCRDARALSHPAAVLVILRAGHCDALVIRLGAGARCACGRTRRSTTPPKHRSQLQSLSRRVRRHRSSESRRPFA